MRALSILILLAAALPAGAAERWHTVVFGESASGIAKRYYGDFSHTDLVLGFNERTGTDLKPGERLRIPYCTDHRVAPGDNGSTLAKRYLGRGSAWEAIARLNGLIPEAPLRPGQIIAMPVVLRYTLARGDSLSDLAAKYYDDPGRGSLLQVFNGIADPRDLSVGQAIEVPLIGVRLSERRPESKPESKAVAQLPPPKRVPVPVLEPESEPEAEPVLPAWFAGDFSVAERAYREGDYEAARDRLEQLIERIDAISVAEERSRVWQLAAFVEIAFDRGEHACSAFESMRSTGAALALDPDQVSPKIREALEACNSR